MASCFSRWNDAASRTRSFIRNGTLPVIAGNPPADATQPSGMNGMMVMVMTNDRHEPAAPRAPRVLFQKPMKMSAPNSHSETPRNQLAPRMPNAGYIQEMSGPLLMKGINVSAS